MVSFSLFFDYYFFFNRVVDPGPTNRKTGVFFFQQDTKRSRERSAPFTTRRSVRPSSELAHGSKGISNRPTSTAHQPSAGGSGRAGPIAAGAGNEGFLHPLYTRSILISRKNGRGAEALREAQGRALGNKSKNSPSRVTIRP